MKNSAEQQSLKYNESAKEKLARYAKTNMGILIALIALCVFLSIASDNFLTGENIVVVLRQVAINAFIAFGMTYIILIGMIDLSPGSVMALCGIISVSSLVRAGLPIWISILLGLLVGAALGLFNGLVIAKMGLPAFIVTLGTQYIAKGFAYIISDGQPITITDMELKEQFASIGNGYIGPIAYPIIYMVGLYIVFAFILYKTRFGRHLYAFGGNPEAAKYSGIKTTMVIIIPFLLTGIMSALAGIVQTARLYSGQPTIGTNAELDAIAAVVLGGTSFTGGRGTLGGTLIGAIVMGVLSNGLNLLGVSSFWQWVAKGFIIIIAVYIDILRKNSLTSRRKTEKTQKQASA